MYAEVPTSQSSKVSGIKPSMHVCMHVYAIIFILAREGFS